MTPPNVSLLMIMACFWVTLWLVQRFLIVPLGAVLAERRSRIDGAETSWAAKNEESRSATARLEAEMEDAARAAAQVREAHRRAANDRRQATLGAVRERAEAGLGEALARIDGDAAAARHELRQQAESLARTFASRLIGREVRS